jgi:hypothetical protein
MNTRIDTHYKATKGAKTMSANITHIYAAGMTDQEKKTQRRATRKAIRTEQAGPLAVTAIPEDWKARHGKAPVVVATTPTLW